MTKRCKNNIRQNEFEVEVNEDRAKRRTKLCIPSSPKPPKIPFDSAYRWLTHLMPRNLVFWSVIPDHLVVLMFFVSNINPSFHCIIDTRSCFDDKLTSGF